MLYYGIRLDIDDFAEICENEIFFEDLPFKNMKNGKIFAKLCIECR